MENKALTLALAAILHVGALLIIIMALPPAVDAANAESHHFSHGLSATRATNGVTKLSSALSSVPGKHTEATIRHDSDHVDGDPSPRVTRSQAATDPMVARMSNGRITTRSTSGITTAGMLSARGGVHSTSTKTKYKQAAVNFKMALTLPTNPISSSHVKLSSTSSGDATLACLPPCVIAGGKCVHTNGTL